MDNKIIAELLHPEIQGPPLDRGTRYGHHFVVELISDGRRLIAVASEEGRKLLHEIAHGIGLNDGKTYSSPDPTIAEWVAAGYSAKAYPPSGHPSQSSDEEIAAAIMEEEISAGVGKQFGTGTEALPNNSGSASVVVPGPNAEPNLPPPPEGQAPTTTTASANSFDS